MKRIPKKSVRSKSVPRPARSPKPRTTRPRTARLARGRTRPVPSARKKETPFEGPALLPARTLARQRVLAYADELGMKLSKPALRRATDRIERSIKAARATETGVRSTVADAPSLSALDSISGRPFVNEPLLKEPYEQTRGAFPIPIAPPLGNPPTPASPWSSAYTTLDDSTQRLGQRIEQLAMKLSPVTLAPQNPPGVGASVGGSAPGTPHLLEGIEIQRSRVDYLTSRVAELIERVVV